MLSFFRSWKKSLVLWAGISAAILIGTPGAFAHSHESWYTDVRRHWAENYVQILWDEGITDGYSVRSIHPFFGRRTRSRYYPDRSIYTDSWLTLLARTFDLQRQAVPRIFFDITHPHRLHGGQEVHGLLQAAGRAGFMPGPSLRPRSSLTREAAAAALVRSLGLAEYAQSLTPAEILQRLQPFKDAHSLSRSLRPLIAAAVEMGIVQGYPDRTLRPRSNLRRSEASAMVARSALVRAIASPNPFAPDGDGFEEETVFSLSSLRNRNMSDWRLAVTDDRGSLIWQVRSKAGDTHMPGSVIWRGNRNDGGSVPAGRYYYQAFLNDRKGHAHQSVRQPLDLLYRRLETALHPAAAAPGETFSLQASTEGDGQAVTYTWLDETTNFDAAGPHMALRQNWSARSVAVPALAEGFYPIEVRALYPGTSRTQMLWLNVRTPVGITGQTRPEPVYAGIDLIVEAKTRGQVHRVAAIFEDGFELDLALAENGEDIWAGAYPVPPGTEMRPYTLELTATGPSGSASDWVIYTVAGHPLAELIFMLTD
ncbi:MAG: S-layer homology domain-containing protein [Thermaerobacterales bacterium]